MLLLRAYSDNDLTEAIQGFNDFFEYNPDAEIIFFEGVQVTRLVSSFECGWNYNKERRPLNLFPVGTVGHALAWHATRDKVFIDRDGTYKVEYDFEVCRLVLKKDGLCQVVNHFYRVGRCFDEGPNSKYEKGLCRQITTNEFLGDGTNFTGKAEYQFTHSFASSKLADITTRINLSARKIVRVLEKFIPAKSEPHECNSFRPVRALGIETQTPGVVRTCHSGNWRTSCVQDGNAIQDRPRFSSGGISVWK